MQSRSPPIRAVVASGICILAAGIVLGGYLEFGSHARHMAAHILAMNVAAPLLAAVLVSRTRLAANPHLLWLATSAQIALLWFWHVPLMQKLSADMPGALILSQGALFLSATFFWTSLFSLSGPSRWQAVPALLLTGKLVCLLGALLVFAPRALYGSAHAAHGLDDQHLAGLLMLAACPLSYLVAAVFMTVHLIGAGESPIRRTTG